MPKALDLAGQKFGKLTAVKREDPRPDGRPRRWICHCDCGRQTAVEVGNLRNGNSTSCGCLLSETTASRAKDQFDDLIGRVFGRLVVVDRANPAGNSEGNVRWLCACVCGGLTIAPGHTLTSGRKVSCGCAKGMSKAIRTDVVRLKSSISSARRRAAELLATKPFDVEFFEMLEAEAYSLCIARKSATDIEWNVHHVVPLRSDVVCGLHNEFNLTVIPASENMSIGNRRWPDMP